MKEEYSQARLDIEQLISEALGITAFSYNSVITDEVLGVLGLVASKDMKCAYQIAEELSLKASHVELIQYMLCNNDHGEYGTSPRCMWLTEKGRELYKKILKISKDATES